MTSLQAHSTPVALELVDRHPAIHVLEAEYKRLLGFPRHHPLEGRSRELADWARQWYAKHGEPWVYARETEGLEITEDKLRINGAEFTSERLCAQFIEAEADGAVLVAVSAGRQCEEKARELWREGKPDEYFFLEVYGSAVVEHLITATGARICDWAERNGMAVLPHYSPGYSGWNVAEQNQLLALIRRQQNGNHFSGELDVLESGMLRPKKSLLAVFGITRQAHKARSLAALIPCENCSFSPCQYRRAPYVHSLPQVEDVRRLQPTANDDKDGAVPSASALNHAAKYSVNLRALRKWSQERLQLDALHDGSIEARFRYEGTTCSSMGRPLAFDYHLKLTPPGNGYRITASTCLPAPGDTGHTSQCEYLNDAESLMRSIAEEKPLLGKPLNDVLAWQRPYNPSGCYCDADRRAHKWGLVLEVLHFALVQRERKTGLNSNPAIESQSR